MSLYSDLILATTGLISYWRLGEASGNALDSKGSNHGVINGAVTRNVAGLLTGDADGAVQTSGAANIFIQIPDNANLRLPELTVECWAKPSSLPAVRGSLAARWIVSDSWFLEYSSSSRWRWYVRPSSGSDMQVDTGSAAPALTPQVGVRQHIVGTYSVADGIRLYINGTQVAALASTGFGAKTTAGNVLLSSLDSAASFPGTLDEVAIYSGVLTPQQILDHYNVGLGARIYADVRTGTMALSGTRTESYAVTRNDTPTGTLSLSGVVAAESGVVAGAAPWAAMRIHERPPLRHSIALTTPTNRHYRWGEDEPRPENVFNGLRWGSTMPGGYDSCDCVLPRKPGVTYNDLERLSTLQIINASGSAVGEYRLERTPQTSGDQMAITPSAVGWQAHLDDNKGVSIIFIDRELGDWNDPSRQRTLDLLGAGYNPVGGGNVAPDTTTGTPTIDIGFDDPGGWTATARPIVEATYDAGPGNSIGRLKASWSLLGQVLTDVNWTLTALLSNSDTLVGNDSSGDLFNGIQGSSGVFNVTTSVRRRFAAMQFYYGIAGGVAGSNIHFGVFVFLVRVYGDHLLTIRGSTPQTEGLLASDMIAYSVAKWAPMLRVTADSIQATSFIIPQAKFKDSTTVSEIVKQSTRFGLEDWAVWNDKIFYLSPRNANPLAKKWRARIGPAKLEQTGPQMDRLWESILVQYTDVDGTTRLVGPPGSYADTEDARLKDSDPANPSNALGITRRDKLIMGTSTTAGAIEVGRRFLEEQKLVDRSGRASLVGHVEDDRGIMHAYSDIRAGDVISFIDAADQSYRRIVKVSHDYSSKTASVDLDAPPEGLQAVLERLGVVLAPLGL